LDYLSAEGVWVFPCNSGQFAVCGGPDGQDPIRFVVAQRVAAHIDEFISEANDYLAVFVLPERFESSGPWEYERAEFGPQADDSVNVFEMSLTLHNDIYGWWAVRFVFAGSPLNRFYPNWFSRQQR
jgi:hypothetical protein